MDIVTFSTNAPEKNCSFLGRLLFFSIFLLFSRVLFGGNDIFRIFANSKGGVSSLALSKINPKKL